MCHATLSQGLMSREAHGLQHPATKSGLPSSAGSKPLVGPASPGPTSAPVHAEAGPKAQNAPKLKAQRESLHQA